MIAHYERGRSPMSTDWGAGERQLRAALRRWRTQRKREHKIEGVDTTPACLHGVVVQEALDALRGDLDDIKAELAWIRRVIIGAIVTAALGTLLRLGGLQ
jgi:hypothetical protein